MVHKVVVQLELHPDQEVDNRQISNNIIMVHLIESEHKVAKIINSIMVIQDVLLIAANILMRVKSQQMVDTMEIVI